MKKLFFIIPVLALLLSACSEGKDPEIGPEGGDVARSYLKVALYAPVSSTRVPGYQDGTVSENQVNSVRFFFFKASGDACMVFKQAASGTYLSYIDWTPYDGDINNSGDPDITVEKIVTATLGLNQPANEGLPSLVLAVVNPTTDILALPNPNLSDLRDLVNDYYTGLYDHNFLITNSVYVNSDGNEITATPISANNFGDPTDEESMENMETLNIFVERVLARLDFYLMLNPATNPSLPLNGSTIYQVSTPSVDGNPESAVYVKLLGWNVTATSNSSRAIKMINPDWNEEIFGGINNPWYISSFHRSYWAINPQELEYNYGDFNNAQAQEIPATTDAPETVYLQENAADYTSTLSEDGPETPTCVIIGAQLVNASGQPMLLARWANRYYTQDNLLTAVANVLNLYQQIPGTDNTSFNQITPDYLEFVSPSDVTLPDGETAESYYAYVQLNDDGQGISWYNGNTPDATPLSTDAANTYILNRVNYVLVWSTGYTYYYFDIRHLGSEGNAGYYGIVRNHLYQANLTGITGLGTPVFDPEDVIYPTMPSPEDNTLNVQVNILQWRIVSQDYELTWP